MSTTSFSPAIRTLLQAPDDKRRLGPYACKELLDEAGSAPVFRAIEEHGGRTLREVAVKVFDIGKATDGSRVVDEARALCRVQHPNVVRFHTLSTDTRLGLMGLVMELAKGTSLDREIADLPAGDPQRVELAVEIGISISSALAAAHEAGVVHCNVKPSNIMLTDGTHKLINFGIAASVRQTIYPGERAGLALDDLPVTAIGKKASTLDASGDDSDAPITGTVGYIDPICLKTTTPPGSSSDLYSLGATLYQCIAGHVPALKNGVVDKDVLLGNAAPTPLLEVAPSTPPALAKLIDSLVAAKRESRPRSADVVRHSLERIRSALAGHERELPSEDRGPFPGLDKYEAADRDVFFGRAAEVAGVIELLRSRGLVGIVGLSGVGKSSLTRAGVVPAIEEGALGGWPPKYRSVIVTPGRNLWAALDAALSKLLGKDLAEHPEAVAQQLAANVDQKGEGIVILVDQLEEIVTLYDAKEEKGRLDALDLLSRLAEAPVGVRVIVTARRDLLDDILAVDPHFSRALSRGTQQLSPVSRAGWEEVLDQALEAYGYKFEDDDLRYSVLKDLERLETATPLAQFGLARLWAARDTSKKVIGKKGFSEKRGLRGALEEHADASVAALSAPKDKIRDVLLKLTTPEGTRAHVSKKELGEHGKEVVTALTKARLVLDEKDGVTFVHDAILKEWELVRRWLEEARDDRLLVAHAERDARRWSESRDAAELWRKGRLAAGLELWKRETMPLSDDVRSFLAASAKDEQSAQRAKWLVAIGFLALVLGALLFYVKITKDSADQAHRDATALAAALADVKVLKQQADESAAESAQIAKLLHDLQEKMNVDQVAFGANVKAVLKNATTLDGAQKAAEALKAPTTGQSLVIPLPTDVGGPKLDVGGLGGPSPSIGGGGFDQAAIERVVASRKTSVKRTCLERSSSTAASTKVTATITIAPNGTVQNVTSAGDDPGVARCIEQQLKTWSFPAPGETKQVQIPFVFVRQ